MAQGLPVNCRGLQLKGPVRRHILVLRRAMTGDVAPKLGAAEETKKGAEVQLPPEP